MHILVWGFEALSAPLDSLGSGDFRGVSREDQGIGSSGGGAGVAEEVIFSEGIFWRSVNPISEASNYAPYVRL